MTTEVNVLRIARRNQPSTANGDSITVTTTYSSFDKETIDLLEKAIGKGVTRQGWTVEGFRKYYKLHDEKSGV